MISNSPFDIHGARLDCWRDAVADAQTRLDEAREKADNATGSKRDYWLKRLKKAQKDLTRAERTLKRISIVK